MTQSKELKEIIDDVYKIGRTDEAMQIDDYTRLKPGILKKVDSAIEEQCRLALEDMVNVLVRVRSDLNTGAWDADFLKGYDSAIRDLRLEADDRIKELKEEQQ